MKKSRLNYENIFIFSSIVIITLLILIYGTRLVYFYIKENKKVVNNTIVDLYQAVSNNIVISGDGLVNDTEGYYFRGKNVNNYINYSNMLFRIISLNNNTLTLIMDTPITNLYYDKTYNESIVKSFLEEDFYKVINQEYLVDTNTCINAIFNEEDNCTEKYTAKVVLPSFSLYKKLGSQDSFMNNGYYYYLSNASDDDYGFVDDKGYVATTDGIHLYGIRPMITIRTSNIVRGDGSKENPYMIESPKTSLKEANVGSYVYYSDLLWRITKNDTTSRLILDDTLPGIMFSYENYSIKSEAGKYLNGEFLDSLDKTYLAKGNFYVGTFDTDTKSLFTKLNTYVGLPYMFEFFINDTSDYALMNLSKYNEVIYQIKNNGITYQNKIDSIYKLRPVIYMENNLILTGYGTINNPYMIGGVLGE